MATARERARSLAVDSRYVDGGIRSAADAARAAGIASGLWEELLRDALHAILLCQTDIGSNQGWADYRKAQIVSGIRARIEEALGAGD